jgi:2-oxoglutarate dehydrogenase complex dehydrogenase (E1) component-like enzyme
MYCGPIGVEFEHITDEAERLWCYETYEQTMLEEVNSAEKIKALQLLIRTECME